MYSYLYFDYRNGCSLLDRRLLASPSNLVRKKGRAGRDFNEHVATLVTYLVEHFNVRRIEIVGSSEKPAVTS